jgi:hypothetical protein
MRPQTVGRYAFKATASDVTNIEQIAAAIRLAGQPFATKSDAIRVALSVAASDLGRVIEGSAK